MNSILIILLVLISILTLFYIYLLVLSNKILELEILIKKLLHQRTDLIPALYEVTKPYLLKHDEIFKEILTLRKLELSLNDSDDVSFIEVLKNERLIHHEMNFIYSICMKN
jgi:hypothetical protein